MEAMSPRSSPIWQVVTNSETYSSPFFAITPHLILWHYGWSLEFTFVTTFNMLSIPKTLFVTQLRSKCLTMASTSLMTSSVATTSLSVIGQPCHFLRMIGLQAVGNRLIAEQRSYNIDEQALLATQRIPTLIRLNALHLMPL